MSYPPCFVGRIIVTRTGTSARAEVTAEDGTFLSLAEPFDDDGRAVFNFRWIPEAKEEGE